MLPEFLWKYWKTDQGTSFSERAQEKNLPIFGESRPPQSFEGTILRKNLRKGLPRTISLYFVTVSLAGLLLLTALTFTMSTVEADFSWRKNAIGAFFGLICLLGTLAGLYPSKCSTTIHFRKKQQYKRSESEKQVMMKEENSTFEGHHPNCGEFSAHIISLSDKKYCAGCTGLAIGGFISLLGTMIYLFTGVFLSNIAVAIFWIGFAGVTLGLLQYSLSNIQESFTHLFLNIIFVLGSFLLFIGIEEITGNIVLETYFIVLIIYWILTRILLSQNEHRKICAACGSEFCMFLK